MKKDFWIRSISFRLHLFIVTTMVLTVLLVSYLDSRVSVRLINSEIEQNAVRTASQLAQDLSRRDAPVEAATIQMWLRRSMESESYVARIDVYHLSGDNLTRFVTTSGSGSQPVAVDEAAAIRGSLVLDWALGGLPPRQGEESAVTKKSKANRRTADCRTADCRSGYCWFVQNLKVAAEDALLRFKILQSAVLRFAFLLTSYFFLQKTKGRCQKAAALCHSRLCADFSGGNGISKSRRLEVFLLALRSISRNPISVPL